MADAVLVDARSEGVTVITLNRPEVHNAINDAVLDGVTGALDELNRRDDQRVGIITGAGRSFCSGMDLKGFTTEGQPFSRGRTLEALTRAPSQKPLIAAVEGYALAGGCEIMLACDMVVAARNAEFGIPEVKRGLVASAGGLLRLPQRIPRSVAAELALTGATLDAQRAHMYGLVNRLTEEGEALAGALLLGQAIAANGPLAVRTSKRILSEASTWPADESWQRMLAVSEGVLSSEDAKEGALAFVRKRAPRWSDR
ncbi:crotonase/enoyl-CoA hydratase family protein [Streptomyces sp. NPDC005356]|uniref:crotonase/enoyl-CoA hydratase family protein n=1 Tax=Streptomyces sp. NPDC005356 TaxID=3157167 RepID=UPI0033BF5944